jgi:hypothetical protein
MSGKCKPIKKTPSQLRKDKIERDMNKQYRKFSKLKFPNCIGTFPDCTTYKEEDLIENRKECTYCPYK